MALVLADRVQQTGTANTTVSFTLSGSVTGFQSFSVVGNGNTTYYAAFDASGNWETGLGTYSTTGPTLTRTTIYQSSNSNLAVTFSGTVNIFVTYPSGKSINLDASGNASALGTIASGVWNGTAIGTTFGGTGATTAQGGMNALAGAVTSGSYLRGNGTNVVMSTIQAADVPTLNQNTTGSAGSVTNAVTFNNAGTGAVSGTTYNGSAAQTISYNTIGAQVAGTYVTSVTGTSPVSSSGGTTPAISLAASYGDTQNPYASKTANFFLAAPNGAAGVPSFRAIAVADIPTLNQNTTGTASNVTGTVAIANGGSGTTTAQGAMNAFAGAVTAGSYLRGNGTNVVMSTIQAADVPTLNQNTTGSAGSVAAGNITGTTLAATVTASSLTSFGASIALGSPASGNFTVGTFSWPTFNQNTTGSAASATNATNVANTTTTSASTFYPAFMSANTSTNQGTNTNGSLTYVPSTGVLTAVSMVSSSDERLKTNWSGLDLDFVAKLQDVKHGTFERISSGNREVGVTAQSLKEVLPEAVVADENGMLAVNYGGAALVAAIELAKVVQELRDEIKELKRNR